MYYKFINNSSERVMVFLHGWGTDSTIFSGVVSLLPRNISFLLIDFAGFGQSPEPQYPYTVDDYAREVVELLDTLKIKKATILGHSFGGRVGIVIAEKYWRYVERLVLVDSAGVKNKSLCVKFKKWWYKVLKKCVSLGLLSGARLQIGSSDYRALKSDIMRKTFVNVVEEDLVHRANRIRADTLLVWGGNDEATPLKDGKILNKAIVGSKLVVIESAGHYCFVDKMQEFVYILYDELFF